MEMATFWNEQHPLSEKAKALMLELVPTSGNCATLQGEMLRAVGKIQYDWFNNGWGCNNWSGAVVFIKENFKYFPNLPDQCFVDELMKELGYVSEYSHGEPCNMNYNGRNCRAVTKITEIIVNAVLANPTLIPNVMDMWDFCEHDYRYEHDNEEEEDRDW